MKRHSMRFLYLMALSSCLSIPATAVFGQNLAAPPLRHVPWLAEVQPQKTLPENGGLPDLLTRPDGSTVTSADLWLVRRQELRQFWETFLGLPQRDPDRPIASLEILQREELEDVSRYLIRYDTPGDWPTEAYLIFPRNSDPFKDGSARRPGVVVFHSTTNDTIRQPAGLSGETTKAFGLQLARRGYVTLSPRCYLWSEGPPYEYQEQVRRFQKLFPGAKGMAKMLLDAMAAVDLLTSLPGVDATRIGAIGHSLGGKEVLYLAAFDERVRATVSSEGGIGLTFSNWDAPWYLGAEVRQPDFPHDHHELLALVAPRAFLLVGGDSADGEKSLPYLRAAWDVYRLFTDQPALGLWNHRQGHTVPEEALARIADWFDAYLRQ